MNSHLDTAKDRDPSVITVAITGGPSGGKTTLLETLRKELGPDVSMVPEAATLLYRGGFPRLKSLPAVKCAQRAIYFTQRELEKLVHTEKNGPILLCDRGSLDGIAYWPGDGNDFLNELQTTREEEFRRYDWLLHLDTASVENYDLTNPVRTETYVEAWDLNEKIKRAWEGHPCRIIIPQRHDFLSKMTLCVGLVRMILQKKSFDEVKQYVAKY